MLRFPEINKEFKIVKADDSITYHGGPKRLFTYFTDSLSRLETTSFQFDVDILKSPFREFAWLFAWVTDQESTTLFPQYALYVIY